MFSEPLDLSNNVGTRARGAQRRAAAWRSPSPLNGERAGVRGENVLSCPNHPSQKLVTSDFPVHSKPGTFCGSEKLGNHPFFHVAADWKVRAPFTAGPRRWNFSSRN